MINTQTLSDRLIGCLFICGLLASPSLAAKPAGDIAEATDPSSVKVDAPTRTSLAQLAAAADVVALVQMRDGDYRYQREFPISGSAYLKVLIPYKVDQPLDLIDVYERGLRENECYFPNPTVFEEGRRYLVFLRRDPEDPGRYRGLPEGCALDVLVTEDNGYALRIPVTGIKLSDPLVALAEPIEWADPYSRETVETLDSTDRDEWLGKGWLRRDGEELVYTQGVSLESIRELMGPEGVSLDWHQKRIPPPKPD